MKTWNKEECDLIRKWHSLPEGLSFLQSALLGVTKDHLVKEKYEK